MLCDSAHRLLIHSLYQVQQFSHSSDLLFLEQFSNVQTFGTKIFNLGKARANKVSIQQTKSALSCLFFDDILQIYSLVTMSFKIHVMLFVNATISAQTFKLFISHKLSKGCWNLIFLLSNQPQTYFSGYSKLCRQYILNRITSKFTYWVFILNKTMHVITKSNHSIHCSALGRFHVKIIFRC